MINLKYEYGCITRGMVNVLVCETAQAAANVCESIRVHSFPLFEPATMNFVGALVLVLNPDLIPYADNEKGLPAILNCSHSP